MTTDYRIVWANIKTPAEPLGELPIEEVSWSFHLNAPGAIRGTLPLDPFGPFTRSRLAPTHPTAYYQIGTDEGQSVYVERPVTATAARVLAKSLFGPASFGTARTVVYVVRDGVVQKGGIVWEHQASVERGSLTFNGEGWHSYFRERTIQTTLTYTSTDQDTIARGLIAHAQAQGGGDIGIQTTANPHGVTRDRTYPWHDGKNLGEALEDLTRIENGFDFDYPSSYNSAGELETNFTTTYPATGRETDHVFELGTNVALVNYGEDGKAVRNQHRAFGAGFGSEVKTAVRFNSPSISAYPLLEGRSTHPEVLRDATLADHADRSLQRGAEPSTFLTLQVYPDQVPRLGSYFVGDLVWVSADYGYIQLDRERYRIVSHEVSVSQGDGEVSTLTLAPQGVFA